MLFRSPLRGTSTAKRPTLAQAQTQRAEREAAYQETRRREQPEPERAPRPAAAARVPVPRRDAPPVARQQRPAPPRRAPVHHDHHGDRDQTPAEHAPGSMRLSKRMSELGIASRREADEWIPKGWVRVDDQIVAELGSRVLPGQRITVDAKAKFQQAQRVTVLVNKPVGYVSGQAEDGYEPAVVLVTPQNQWREDHRSEERRVGKECA